MCVGTYEPQIQKDNGTDVEGYHTYQVSIGDNQTYPVKYKISSNATLESIGWEKESPNLNIIVQEVAQGGNLTIQLPTKLLGSYNGGYFMARGTMCAMIGDVTFPTPIESNSNFTTVSFPLMNYDGVREMIVIEGNHAIPEFQSPLKQFKSGIPAKEIQCNQGFQLILKREDSSPACVAPNTANILIERGWGFIRGVQTFFPFENFTNTKTSNPLGVTALVIYHPFLGCLSSGCPPNNFYLKINSNVTAYLTGYNICDDNSCAKNSDLSILLPINTPLYPNYQSIGLPVSLQWKYGDAVNIQLEVSPDADNKTASLIDLGNSTIVP